MKITQLIPSPHAFKRGLGTLMVAALVPVSALIAANLKESPPTSAKKEVLPPKARKTAEEKEAVKPSAVKPVAKRQAPEKEGSGVGEKAGSSGAAAAKRGSSRKETGKGAKTKLESEAERIAARLTPSQKAKLLSLLNSAETEALLGIDGVGKSRCAAIEKARPIESIEGLREIKGLGLKTFEDLVDHGRSLSGSSSKSGTTLEPSPKTSSARVRKDA